MKTESMHFCGVSYASVAQSTHFCKVSYGLAAETIHFYVMFYGLAVLLAASGAPPSGSWLLPTGGGAPRPENPWFEQLYTEKLKDFRQSNINLATLRKEFGADIHSDPFLQARLLADCEAAMGQP